MLKTYRGFSIHGMNREYSILDTVPEEAVKQRIHDDGYLTEDEYKKWIEMGQHMMKSEVGEISDGYHTFNELYHHRAILFASLCNTFPDKAWKSKQHDDPNQPMYDGMFICGITTPEGEATYHYDINPYWDMFHVKELDRAPAFDGHTPQMAIDRLMHMFVK